MSLRLLFLGGSNFQVEAIKAAKEMGAYVITCDYKADNPGHKFADEYHNVSTTDLHGVLNLARDLKINGVLAYASDPAAPTAAYVSEQLGLPGNSFSAVEILANKNMYRQFLKEEEFATPDYRDYFNIEIACAYSHYLLPAVVKPVDSSGSKGVSVIHSIEELPVAFEAAKSFSRKGKVIIEEFVKRKGYQIAGDGFVVNGKLVFRCFANEHFNPGGLVPIGESYPSVLTPKVQDNIHAEVQRLIDRVGIKTGGLNFDIVINEEDKIYLMEIGPRSGGNLIPEVTQYATGVDLIAANIQAALGMDMSWLKMEQPAGYFATYMIHSKKDGVFKELVLKGDIADNIKEQNLFVKPGDQVGAFTGSQHTLGTMILEFDNQEEMLSKMNDMDKYVEVVCV